VSVTLAVWIGEDWSFGIIMLVLEGNCMRRWCIACLYDEVKRAACDLERIALRRISLHGGGASDCKSWLTLYLMSDTGEWLRLGLAGEYLLKFIGRRRLDGRLKLHASSSVDVCIPLNCFSNFSTSVSSPSSIQQIK
jgi:hypothetical protein